MKCGKMKIKTPTAMMNNPKPQNTGFLREPPEKLTKGVKTNAAMS